MNKNFDYIIVGAGSAGCVLADRLSEDAANTVCLIEAGPPDTSPLIHMPIGVAGLIGNPKVNWCFQTEPEPQLGARSLYWPRGKTLGGSSSINAMVYMRGHAKDYDDWANDVGDPSWSYQSLLPLFMEHEDNQRGRDSYHGVGGPLTVSDIRDANPISSVFIDAGREVGIPVNRDFNGAVQEGVGMHQVTQRNGRRWSSARAFLEAARLRKNLTVMTGARVTRVILKDKRVVGVELMKDGTLSVIECTHEVVLSGGAVNSPHLLLLSGIGPREEIERQGIPVQHVSPGVGRNLQDHLDYTVMIRDRSRRSIGLALSFIPRAIVGFFRYLFQKRGFLASNVAEAGGFAKLGPDSERPEVQFHFLPTFLKDHGRKFLMGYGCTLHVCQLRPKSRGYIGLKSADPMADPMILANYLDHPDDAKQLIDAVKLTRRILAAPAFKSIHGGEVEPGIHVQSDADILKDIRKRAETIYHPVGTCKMGRDEMAVVDRELRVIGIEGLRVADASIMPTLIGGNTNAPVMVIGERAARMMLASKKSAAVEALVKASRAVDRTVSI